MRRHAPKCASRNRGCQTARPRAFGTLSEGWGYGFDGSIADVESLLVPGQFPALKYLRLRDTEIADQFAAAVAKSPVINQLEVFDLSLGALGDEGGQALLDCPAITNLK
jgi:hypothetical protein